MKPRYVLLLVITSLFPACLQAQYALEFIANKGQWDGPFRYKAIAPGGDIYLEEKGITYMISDHANADLVHDYKHGKTTKPPTLKFHAYKVDFVGASTPVKIKEEKKRKYYYNYYLGNDPQKWKANINPSLNVVYEGIYPGIDAHFSSEKKNLKYDFVVKPGADAAQIQLKFTGVDGINIKGNRLEIKTSVGTITEMAPYAYQYINGERKEVRCEYRKNGNAISYEFPKGYDKQQTLIIDPTVVFSSFTGATSDNWGFTATYDPQGNFYAGGIVNGIGYPTTAGAYNTTFSGGGTGGNQMSCDIAITKFDPTGSGLVYSTFLGGSNNETPHSLIVDGSGNLVVAGRTFSNNYPTQNAYDATFNGECDIIVTKFNAAGSALIGSTFVGGTDEDGANIATDYGTIVSLKHNYGDDARSEVIVDNAGNVYVASCTRSLDFPVTANAHQGALQGFQDGVVFKLNSNLSVLTWSTYLGSFGDDAAYVLALNNAQSHLYVAGGTTEPSFPSTAGTFHPNYQGGPADGYILKFQNSGNYTLQRGTFIGAADYDQCYGIQVDGKNNVYAMGQTTGGGFPVTAGVYSNPGSSQFVIKLDSNLTNNVYSTVFGSGNSFFCNISPVAFLVDTCEQVYISGWGGPTASNGGNTNGMAVTANAAQSVTDGADFYFIVLAKDALSLLYATYYGGAGLGEHVDGGTSRFDRNGVVYQGICAGCGGSSAFPTTPDSWSPTNGSTNCNYGALKIAFEVAAAVADASISPNDTGCAPFTVQFMNNSSGTSFEWDFGDNSPNSTDAVPPPHIYTDPGVYTVRLIVENPQACAQEIDTAYLTIVVDSNYIDADFTYQVTDSCDPYVASFTNTSFLGSQPGQTSYQWDFGDGTTATAFNPGSHSYPDTGCYTVRLIITDQTTCNKIDTVEKLVCVQGFNMKAAFNSPDSICLGTAALMSNGSTNAQTTEWDLGDGGSTSSNSPLYTYTQTGTYTITLVTHNPNACNPWDSVKRVIHVVGSPTADFIYEPIAPIPNEPYHFTNKSINATSYFWSFGDGESSVEEHPVHMYNQTGTYRVCLQAKNTSGCVDTICKFVDADVTPALDVPSAFTPNGDGSNDILYVRGAAIKSVDFKVFNRFGELVFETKDMKKGWDGTYKGKPQEMEAYAWVVNATFINGTSASRTGNVTLLR